MVTLAVLDWWVLGRLARAGINRLVLGAEAGDVLRDDGASADVLLRFGAVPAAGASGGPGASGGGSGGPGGPGVPGDEPEAAR
jgi:cytochrome d ubiquinol oxidase subunit I